MDKIKIEFKKDDNLELAYVLGAILAVLAAVVVLELYLP